MIDDQPIDNTPTVDGRDLIDFWHQPQDDGTAFAIWLQPVTTEHTNGGVYEAGVYPNLSIVGLWFLPELGVIQLADNGCQLGGNGDPIIGQYYYQFTANGFLSLTLKEDECVRAEFVPGIWHRGTPPANYKAVPEVTSWESLRTTTTTSK
jgi:hypothetical protein